MLFLILAPLAGWFLPAPAAAAGASLYLSPGSGTYTAGAQFSVSVKINTGGNVVNAAEGVIGFDATKLEVINISKGGSIFPFWTAEPSFSNSAGTISFGGGLPPPAYSGSAGHILAITFRARALGDARAGFNSGAVLANDGKGTNILSGLGSGSYTIAARDQAPKQEPAPPKQQSRQSEPAPPAETEYNHPRIISRSHPDPNQWYAERQAEFSWELPGGVSGVSIAFDQDPTTDPGPASDGLFSTTTYMAESDGIYYLHLKFQDSTRWGTIAHYRTMIDATPPAPFEAKVKQIRIGDWPVIEFRTEDGQSGLLKYEVYIGSLERQAHELKPDEVPLQVSDLSVGEHTALIKAIDQAGNERVVTIKFDIPPIASPEIKDYSRELESTDRFYVSGTAATGTIVNIHIEKQGQAAAEGSTGVDSAGKWSYLHDGALENGRYIVWAETINENGIKSTPSGQKSFLVSPPVFMVIGDFVIRYFTVMASLLFMIILIVMMLVYLVGWVRRRLKKETHEVEDVLHKNAQAMKAAIEREFRSLRQHENTGSYRREKAKVIDRLKKIVEINERRTAKEIKDVEDILK